MQSIKKFLSFFFFSLFFSVSLFAQETNVPIKLAEELVGSWVATMESSNGDRALIIKEISRKTDNSFVLNAKFGFVGKESFVSFAEISETPDGRKLSLTAKSGAKITATQTGEGLFVGTFEGNDGGTKKIKLTKLSTEETQVARDNVRVEPPSKEVPGDCAFFSGKWVAEWGYGVGKTSLTVNSVDTSCVAKILYSGNPVENVEIKKGELKWTCNKSTQGTCSLTIHGNELQASYQNPQGGSNSAVFKKIQ